MKVIEYIKLKIELKKENKPYSYKELLTLYNEQNKELDKKSVEISRLERKLNTANLKYEALINDTSSLNEEIHKTKEKKIKDMSMKCKMMMN